MTCWVISYKIITMNYEGLIPILFGAYFLFRVNYLPISNPKMIEWKSKYKGLINILAPLIILFGLLQLFSII